MIIENKIIKTEDGRKVVEHRYIMEQHLGRKLESYEVVHHINGNHNDNRLENLQVMTWSEHSKLHGKQPKPSSKIKLNRISKNISIEENIFINAKNKAKQMGFNLSSYVTYLINKDTTNSSIL